MKTKSLAAFAVLSAILISNQIQAQNKTWRVNNLSNYNEATLQWGENFGGTTTYPVFKQIDDAIGWSAFTAGDTIHVEGSAIAYNFATINKRAVIIGPGYFLNENQKTSNTAYDAKIGRILFNGASTNSEIIGMNFIANGSSFDGKVYVEVNGVTVKRCRFLYGVQLSSNILSSVNILQNYFESSTSNAIIANGSSNFVPPNDIIFNNNICKTKLIWQRNDTDVWNILECNNNVFDGPANTLNLKFNTTSFKNNIIKANGATATINMGTNANVQYNTVPNTTLFAGTLGVTTVTNMASLFVASASTDGQYQLQSGVAGNVPGSDGAERGAFGGIAPSNRYTLSGLAAIPVIYDVSTTGVSQAGTGMTVQVKARTVK